MLNAFLSVVMHTDQLREGAAKPKTQPKAKRSGPLGLALAGKTLAEKIQLARAALSFCLCGLSLQDAGWPSV